MADVTQTRAQTRLGPMLFAVTAVAIAAFMLARSYYRAPPGNDHRTTRQLVVHLALGHADAPIIVLGDSIVEAAILPAAACGHPIVNAGLSGASTASDLGGWLAPALAGQRAFAVILSLGINDALTPKPVSPEVFASRYGALLRELSTLADHVAVVEFAPVETRGHLTSELRQTIMTRVHSYRAALPEISKRAGAAFLPLPAMPASFTIDGVHLNADGYRPWTEIVLQAAALACG